MKFNNTKERPIWWVGLEVALHQQILLVCNYTREKRPFFGKNMMVRVIWLTSEDSNSPCTCQEDKTVFFPWLPFLGLFSVRTFLILSGVPINLLLEAFSKKHSKLRTSFEVVDFFSSHTYYHSPEPKHLKARKSCGSHFLFLVYIHIYRFWTIRVYPVNVLWISYTAWYRYVVNSDRIHQRNSSAQLIAVYGNWGHTHSSNQSPGKSAQRREILITQGYQIYEWLKR